MIFENANHVFNFMEKTGKEFIDLFVESNPDGLGGATKVTFKKTLAGISSANGYNNILRRYSGYDIFCHFEYFHSDWAFKYKGRFATYIKELKKNDQTN